MPGFKFNFDDYTLTCESDGDLLDDVASGKWEVSGSISDEGWSVQFSVGE